MSNDKPQRKVTMRRNGRTVTVEGDKKTIREMLDEAARKLGIKVKEK